MAKLLYREGLSDAPRTKVFFVAIFFALKHQKYKGCASKWFAMCKPDQRLGQEGESFETAYKKIAETIAAEKRLNHSTDF